MDTWSEPSLLEKEDWVQIVTNDELPFLDTKISWSPEVDLQFGVFRKKGQQLKYVEKESTHKPGTLHAIPSGVQNQFAKLTSRKPSIHFEGVDKIYHNRRTWGDEEAGRNHPGEPTVEASGQLKNTLLFVGRVLERV